LHGRPDANREIGVPVRRDSHPLFFVSVASKGLSLGISLLFATLAGRSVSVADKGVMGAECWRESNRFG
jgi:hypothetical protein